MLRALSIDDDVVVVSSRGMLSSIVFVDSLPVEKSKLTLIKLLFPQKRQSCQTAHAPSTNVPRPLPPTFWDVSIYLFNLLERSVVGLVDVW